MFSFLLHFGSLKKLALNIKLVQKLYCTAAESYDWHCDPPPTVGSWGKTTWFDANGNVV